MHFPDIQSYTGGTAVNCSPRCTGIVVAVGLCPDPGDAQM
jgi:hypothetical protein